jgi:hypothetical protein
MSAPPCPHNKKGLGEQLQTMSNKHLNMQEERLHKEVTAPSR